MADLTKLDLKFDLSDLLLGLEQVLETCDWHPDHSQIGLNHALGQDAEGAWHDATGSLVYAWGDEVFDENGQLKKRKLRRRESDFQWFVKEFKHTVWHDVYLQLSRSYQLGRMRFMQSKPKTCLSWHTDNEHRIHIPLITNPGARLVIEDTAHHLPADGSVYLADTTLWHTAFNSGLEPRIHFVACVLGTI